MPETTDTTEETTETSEESKGPKQLRDRLAQVEAELAEKEKALNVQRMRLLESAFEQVGLSPTEGLGKAIAKEYDGEPTPDALKAYAESEYGFTPQTDQAQGQNPLAGDINAGNARVAQATAQAQSMPQQQIDLDIQKAEEEGNFAQSMALKTQKYLQSR